MSSVAIRTRPFVIVGPQRCGTTLMRLILGSHPEIFCHDEGSSYQMIAHSAHEFGSEGTLIGFKIPQLTEQLQNDRLRDDTTVRCGGLGIRNPLRPVRIIFMVRDPFDTVLSMVTLPGWLECYGSTVLSAKCRDDVGFRARYRNTLDEIHKVTDRREAIAAMIWRYKTDPYLHYREDGLQVLRVDYERLVATPCKELRRICTFLDVRWNESMLAHNLETHPQLLPNGLAIGSTDPRRAVDARSVGGGMKKFNQNQRATIERIAGDTFRALQQSA